MKNLAFTWHFRIFLRCGSVLPRIVMIPNNSGYIFLWQKSGNQIRATKRMRIYVDQLLADNTFFFLER